MDPQERNTAYLWDMRESARAILRFLEGATYAKYAADNMLRSAVERQLEILGEAARRVSLEFQAAHPEIPWRSMIGLRNLLIHEYGEVKADRIWLIASTNVPELVAILDALVPPVDD